MSEITPVLNNVIGHRNGTYTAYFGYVSTYGTTQTIPISSSDNKFSPDPIDRGQPISFLTGTNSSVFSITWDGSTLSWTLDGTTINASSSGADFTLVSRVTVNAKRVQYYTCIPMTALVWIKDPSFIAGDNMILMAVSDPYGNVRNTDSSIKLEMLREGNDYRLLYFGAKSKLIEKTIGINLKDKKWHFLSYECTGDGWMRFSIDGVKIESETAIDSTGLSLGQARSTDVRPGGGDLWTPYLYKVGQGIHLYNLRFGINFNLGLSWIRQLMEIDKNYLGI